MKKELEKVCIQENIRQFGKEWQRERALKHIYASNPWITAKVRNDFHQFLKTTIPSQKDADFLFRYCEEKFLKFFLDIVKIPDPIKWRNQEHLWGQSILNNVDSDRLRIWKDKNYKPSLKTVKTVIHASNKFVRYLSKTNEQFSHLKNLEPL